MSGSLRDVLGLPDPKQTLTGGQVEQFRKSFSEGMAEVNRHLQLLASQGSSAEYQPLEAQKTKLYDAFQKTAAMVDAGDPQKGKQSIERVMAALKAVEGKAADAASGVSAGRDQWLNREEEFNSLLDRIGDMEDAGDPKAATFRKVADAIRQRVNDCCYSQSTSAYDQFRPKFDQVYKSQQQGSNITAPGDKKKADVPLTGVNPEVVWEQLQPELQETDSSIAQLEEAGFAKAPLFRKALVAIRSLGDQQQYMAAVGGHNKLRPQVDAAFEVLNKSRSGGVQLPTDKGPNAGQGGVPKSPPKPGPDAAKGGAPSSGDASKYQSQVLKVGSKGEAVTCLQKLLSASDPAIKADGAFGPATQAAVKAFQKSKGLAADGIVGPKTWQALGGGGNAAPQAPPTAGAKSAGGPAKGAGPMAPTKGGPSLTAGATKDPTAFISGSVGKGGNNDPQDVKRVQEALNHVGKANVRVDGKFSPEVLDAIQEFQKKLGQFNPSGLIEPNRGAARALSGKIKIPPTPPMPKPIEPPVLGKASLDKGSLVWHSTRGILNTNIEELKKGVRASYGTEYKELLTAIDGSMVKLNKVVDKLDTRLADALDNANNAKEGPARVKELKKAQTIMKEYLSYVDSEPLIGHMDKNPFGVKTSLQKIISDAIAHLNQLLPEAETAATS